jgi:hypothetical protein
MGTDKASLPSDVAEDTRQRSNLCRVPPNALGKETGKVDHWCFRCQELVQLALNKVGAFA